MQNSRARTLLVKTVLMLVAEVARWIYWSRSFDWQHLPLCCYPREYFRARRRDLLAA